MPLEVCIEKVFWGSESLEMTCAPHFVTALGGGMVGMY